MWKTWQKSSYGAQTSSHYLQTMFVITEIWCNQALVAFVERQILGDINYSSIQCPNVFGLWWTKILRSIWYKRRNRALNNGCYDDGVIVSWSICKDGTHPLGYMVGQMKINTRGGVAIPLIMNLFVKKSLQSLEKHQNLLLHLPLHQSDEGRQCE